jgi:hypothetical protein
MAEARRGTVALALLVVLVSAVPVLAQAGRTRPGGSSAGASRASGRATYGYSGYRGGGGHGYHGYTHRGHYYGGIRVGFGFGFYPYYRYWHSPYYYGWWYPPYVAYRPTVITGGVVAPRAPAAVETAVKPKRADVYVDGQYVGQARDYNGNWDLLWIEPGEHTLEFRREGYKILRTYVDLSPGGYLRLDSQLVQGEGLDARSTSAPERYAEAEPRASPPPPPREERRGAPEDSLRRGLLRIDAFPPDAAVYLDGEFLASADELDRLHGALPVAQGTHRIEVVRPGYASESLPVDVYGPDPVRVRVTLEQR